MRHIHFCFVCLFVGMLWCLFVYLLVCLFVYLFIYLLVCLFVVFFSFPLKLVGKATVSASLRKIHFPLTSEQASEKRKIFPIEKMSSKHEF